jgi:hypothetical protein
MIIVLKDKQTLEDELAKGKPLDGLEAEVDEQYVIWEVNGLCEWNVFKLKDSPLIYVTKTVSGLTDHFVYCKPEELQFGSKEDWLNQGCSWLFEGDNYAEEIGQNGDLFKILGGSYVCNAECGDIINPECLVTEWVTDADSLNPRLLCIEIGNFVEFYQGCQILETEVEFL